MRNDVKKRRILALPELFNNIHDLFLTFNHQHHHHIKDIYFLQNEQAAISQVH